MAKEVILISTGSMFFSLCSGRLGDTFSVIPATAGSYLYELEVHPDCRCVLIDLQSVEEIELVALSRVLEEIGNMEGIVLCDGQRTVPEHIKALCGSLRYVNFFSEPDALISAVAGESIPYIIRHGESFVQDSVAPAEYAVNDLPLTENINSVQGSPEDSGALSSAGNHSFLLNENHQEHTAEEVPDIPPSVVASSFIMNHFYERIKKAAQNDENILLLGESGSGKSWTAQKIHELSPRRKKTFFKVNVAEFNGNLVESTLFGTTNGAFTDAMNHNGVFSAADGGTLFLDEIGELPVLLQAKLLGVLETHRYRKLGSMKEYSFDEKLIFATNRNLEECIKNGTFRQDLYYRISSIILQVPPLREHLEDIPEIARKVAAEKNKQISMSALDRLSEYTWPGNIRELESVVKRACIFSSSETISADDIRFSYSS